MEKISTFSAVEYANTSLPQRPLLAPWVNCIQLGDERLQFRSSQFNFTLSHSLLIGAFCEIRDLLDGNHEVEEIASSGGEVYFPTTIVFLLKMLRAHGVLHEYHPIFSSSSNLEKRQAVSLSHVLQDPGHAIEIFSKSRIGLIGDSSLVDDIHSSLKNIGIQKIYPSTIESLYKVVKEENLEFLIVCKESASYSFFEEVNALCINLKIRWLHISMEGTSALIGPTIVPLQTACYKCFSTRIESHVPNLESHLAFKNNHNGNSLDSGYFTALGKLVSSQIAMEIARIFIGYSPPETFGRYYKFDIREMIPVGHYVLRFPGCSACYKQKSPVEIWDPNSISEEK